MSKRPKRSKKAIFRVKKCWGPFFWEKNVIFRIFTWKNRFFCCFFWTPHSPARYPPIFDDFSCFFSFFLKKINFWIKKICEKSKKMTKNRGVPCGGVGGPEKITKKREKIRKKMKIFIKKLKKSEKKWKNRDFSSKIAKNSILDPSFSSNITLDEGVFWSKLEGQKWLGPPTPPHGGVLGQKRAKNDPSPQHFGSKK